MQIGDNRNPLDSEAYPECDLAVGFYLSQPCTDTGTIGNILATIKRCSLNISEALLSAVS